MDRAGRPGSAGQDRRDRNVPGVRGAQPDETDTRASTLYREEQPPLGIREAWHLLAANWEFIDAHRRLVITKCMLALGSLVFFLLTPWPIKIVIDNVIDRHPLTGLPRTILLPLVGNDRALLLAVLCGLLLFTGILMGFFGDVTWGLDTEVRSGGLDQAGFTANQANDGWSLWNGLFGLLEVRVTLELTQRINHGVRTAVYERFLRAPLGLHSDQKIGDAVFRVMDDSAAICAVFYQGILAPLISMLTFVLVAAILAMQFHNQPLIPILAVLALPGVALGGGLFARLLRDQSQQMRERGSEVMAVFEERLAHVQLVKAFGQETRESARVDAASWESFRSTLGMLILFGLMALVVLPLLGLLAGLGFYHLMLEVIAGRLTLGDLILLGVYGITLVTMMARAGLFWAALQPSVAGMRRIQSVLHHPFEKIGGPGDVRELSGPITTIEFRDVSVAHQPEPPILEHVSLVLGGGELVGLAGASGSGKSTLINLIPRFIEPFGGAILINGIDARMLAPAAIRRRIGFVFQQETLFSASIADNIRYGSAGADDSAIRAAAAMAGAAAFIERMPDGYATMLGRRGARLSVGQKQRVAIARALLRNPDVLVLDEPAAPLDAAAEADLMRTLRTLAATRIVLVVAHHPQTLAACDRILTVDGATVTAG
jgi:ATP-binding cassette, subfamily B, bacterial